MFEEIQVRSLGDLLDKTKELVERGDEHEWLFRGVSDLGHTLLPTVGRVRHLSKPRKVTVNEENRALWRFKDRARPHIDLNLENELEWLVLGQHHGLPTRLLDWTYSPLVAAYFAAFSIQAAVSMKAGRMLRTPIDGAVYAVPRPPKVGPHDRTKPFKIDRVKTIEPPHVSERVNRQNSALTIHPDPLTPWRPKGAKLYMIPNAAKLGMKYELERLGVHEASLFPGVDATARYVSWQMKWDRLK